MSQGELKGSRFGLVLVGVSLLAVGMGQSLVFAVIPSAARRLGLSEFEVGLIFACSALFWMAMSPIWGRWSDSVGRRRVLITGLLGYALSLFLFATALKLGQTGVLLVGWLLPLLLLARTINGVFGSATRPAAWGYVSDCSDVEHRARQLARVESGFTIGTVLGPLLGGFLLIYSLLAPFYLFAACGLLMALMCMWQLREPTSTRSLPTRAKPVRHKLSLKDVRLRPQLIVAALAGLCNSLVLVSFGFYLEDVIGLPAASIGYYASLGLSMAAAGAVFAQWVWVPRFGLYPKGLVQIGALLMAVAMVLLAAGYHISHAWLAMAFYGVGSGMLRPGNMTLLSLSVRPQEQGAAAGMIGMVIPMGHVLTPVIILPLYIWQPRSSFCLAIGILLLIVALMQFHSLFRRSPWRLRYEQAHN